MQVCWGAALSVVFLVGCSGATDVPSSEDPGSAGGGSSGSVAAQRGAALAVTPGVPEDFPRILGCAAEELGNPDDPAIRNQLKRICDAAQVTLYALSKETGMSEADQTTHALLMIGVALEQMTRVLSGANPPATDGGVQRSGGQRP